MRTIHILLHSAAGLNVLLPVPMLRVVRHCRKEGLSGSTSGQLNTIVQVCDTTGSPFDDIHNFLQVLLLVQNNNKHAQTELTRPI